MPKFTSPVMFPSWRLSTSVTTVVCPVYKQYQLIISPDPWCLITHAAGGRGILEQQVKLLLSSLTCRVSNNSFDYTVRHKNWYIHSKALFPRRRRDEEGNVSQDEVEVLPLELDRIRASFGIWC